MVEDLEKLKNKLISEKNQEYPKFSDEEVDWMLKQVYYAIDVRNSFKEIV